MTIKYKYNEGDLLRQITDYVDSTYDEHYSQNKFQATEFIIDGGHGVGFTIGNIMKYAQRYGHKGTPDDWRKDLMKVIHYAIIAMYVHDKENEKESSIVFPLDFNYSDMSIDGFTLKTTLSSDDTITLSSGDILNETGGYFGTMYETPLTTTATNSITITGDSTKKSKKKKD